MTAHATPVPHTEATRALAMATVERAFYRRVTFMQHGRLVTETLTDDADELCEDCGDHQAECVCWMREVDADDRRQA